MKPEYKTLTFDTAADWRKWLDEYHSTEEGVWLRFYKKASGIVKLNYAEALDQALCYGWIDGQVKRGDEQFYLQKFTPRRSKSMWSKRNIEHVDRLTKAGLMMPAGLAEVQKAKKNGLWEGAYDAPSQMTIPDYFEDELNKNPKAKAFFDTLNKANVYAIAWRLQTAKTDETRKRRLQKILSMLEAGEKLH
jgi:uncharacterized protein YdeI (YjbR/CyaY-like superfamily)